MISRFKYDVSKATLPEGRQGPINHYTNCHQAVMLDAWENDDCLRCLKLSFIGCDGTITSVDGWNEITPNFKNIWQGGQGSSRMVQVLRDLTEGVIYLRRPIDIERQLIWEKNRDFRISAHEWWDNDEMNQYWKETYPGIWWVRFGGHMGGRKYIMEARDLDHFDEKFKEMMAQGGWEGETSFEAKIHGPYASEKLAIEAILPGGIVM